GAESIAVDVAVVGENVAADRRVLVGRDRIVLGDRSVVDRRHIDADGGDVAVGAAVVGLVGEAVRDGEGVVWRVGGGAVGGQRVRAVGRTADQHGAERIAVDIAVVDQDIAGDRGILVGRRRVVLRDRGVIDGGDVDADGGDIAVGAAVVGLVGEAV